jgi:hypothetical protein
MLVGHFAAAIVGKSIAREVPLWHFLLLANAADLLWLMLCLLNIEAFNIVDPNIPGASKMLFLDLYKMPWSHSLGSRSGCVFALGLRFHCSPARLVYFWRYVETRLRFLDISHRLSHYRTLFTLAGDCLLRQANPVITT